MELPALDITALPTRQTLFNAQPKAVLGWMDPLKRSGRWTPALVQVVKHGAKKCGTHEVWQKDQTSSRITKRKLQLQFTWNVYTMCWGDYIQMRDQKVAGRRKRGEMTSEPKRDCYTKECSFTLQSMYDLKGNVGREGLSRRKRH